MKYEGYFCKIVEGHFLNCGTPKKNINDLPLLISSGATSSPRSGSSPYQKIHNSLDAAKLKGGGWEGGGGPKSNMSEARVETRLQTHKMSAAKHRA